MRYMLSGLVLASSVLAVNFDKTFAQVVPAESLTIAQGVVYHDVNNNRQFDEGDKPLPGVRVSNGYNITKTDQQGRYKIPVGDDSIIFVIKPRNWQTPINKQMLPQFYYIHKPNGSVASKFPGVKPTGPLPASIDFPLYPKHEPNEFKAIMFGDTQPRNVQEVDWMSHDVIEQLVGTDASLGVTLGDIVFDDLSVMQPHNQSIAILGIPWYNVIGNHDINLDAKNRKDVNETFERVYGPSYYSFDHGPVHFLVVDNIEWIHDAKTKRSHYRGGIGKEQMQFIKNDLALVPDDQLVVLMMHIPLIAVNDRSGLYRLIEKRKFCISISGHTHHHEHVWIDQKDGWKGIKPHHHIINVTVCGSWWSGAKDERGIPHTTMADGAPNGYSILSFNGTDYLLDFYAAGRDKSYQMEISAPELIHNSAAKPSTVYANVFNGSVKTKVRMKIGSKDWVEMKKVSEVDPKLKQTHEREKALLKGRKPIPFTVIKAPKKSSHLWKAEIPNDLPAETYHINIEATDYRNRTYHGQRSIRIEK